MRVGKYITTTMTAIMVLSSVPVSYAADKTPTIYYNNQKVKTDKKPFIVNGTTYVPLRVMSDLFGKDISFDPKTYNINITDKPTATSSDSAAASNSNSTDSNSSKAAASSSNATSNINSDQSSIITTLQQQVTQNNLLILTLEQKLNQLENNLTTQSTTAAQIPATTSATSGQVSALSLSDLQGLLNSSNNLLIRSFQLNNISLYGDSSQITVELDTSLQTNSNMEHWNDLTSDDLHTYFQTMSSKIRQYYPNATIIGKIKNTDFKGDYSSGDPTTSTHYTAVFTVASDGTLNVTKLD